MKPPSSKTLGTLLQEQAEQRGDADAVVFAGRKVRYRELLGEVQRLARGFLALGLRPGDRIVAWLRPEDVREVCRASLASYEVPRVVEFLRPEEVPFTPTGKVRKRDLRDRYVARTEAASPRS